MTKLAHWLFLAQIPDISSRWRWAERTLIVLFAVIFPLAFVFNLPGIWLGFGLGDEFTLSQLKEYVQVWRDNYPYMLPIFAGLMVFHLLFRMWMLFIGHWRFKTNDPELPLKTLVLLISANLVNIFFVYFTLACVGLLAMALGYSFFDGFNTVQLLVQKANGLVSSIPTIVHLPLIVAFFLVYQLQGLGHYWLHRLCHMNRFMWLVLHRIHHLPPVLTGLTTTVVISAVPFFLLMVSAKVFVFGAISQLFYERPLYAEIFAFHILLWIPEIFGHQTKLYTDGIRYRLIRWLSFLGCNGVYHYLHHSSVPFNKNTTNNVNISGGLFCIWDKVFGTYQPLVNKAPPVGLHHRPELTHNPLTLVFSGFFQIVYELYYNKSWKDKLLCLFGSVYYTPPVTKNFLMPNSQAEV